jgi:hypothetical protein
VPNLRTMVTELGTGMGMLGYDDVDEVLAVRSPAMRSLSPDDWDRLNALRAGGAYRHRVPRRLGERAGLLHGPGRAAGATARGRWSGRASCAPAATRSPP